ncbi:hypothetical protein RGQ29_023067 [Quercus rubra]|uniref:3'-5' exonuclease n=2 Tax=Quercus rubra TaxID=3512 RepID=A0AAN7F8G8_QUERU|nr:hypothetical protein RGQ29_023067 [Quercus rubra]
MGEQDEWEGEQGLADEDLRAIDDAIESATKKRRSDDFVESSNPQRSRSRRLPRSIVALQHPNPNPLSRCEMRLSVMKFGGRILYSKTAIDVEQAANHLLHTIANSKSKKTQFVLGFDIEWRPTFTKGFSPGKAAVMQICGDTSHCHVMHIFHSGIPKSLQLLLEDPTLLKVGAGIANDAVKVFKDYNVSIKAVEDLSYLANQKLGGGPHQWGLGSLTKKLISKELRKPNKIKLGNWETNFLSKEQLDYAATDAFASWYLYQVLEGLPNPEVAVCQGSEKLEGATSE